MIIHSPSYGSARAVPEPKHFRTEISVLYPVIFGRGSCGGTRGEPISQRLPSLVTSAIGYYRELASEEAPSRAASKARAQVMGDFVDC